MRDVETVRGRIGALRTLLARAYLESDSHTDPHDLLDAWQRHLADSSEAVCDLSPNERALLAQPVGGWPEAVRRDVGWRVEALSVLLWTTGAHEWPPLDAMVDEPVADAGEALRPVVEIERAWGVATAFRRLLFAWEKTGRVDPALRAELETARGAPFRPSSDSLPMLRSISVERFVALRWLIEGADWDRVSPKPNLSRRRTQQPQLPLPSAPAERLALVLRELDGARPVSNIIPRAVEQLARLHRDRSDDALERDLSAAVEPVGKPTHRLAAREAIAASLAEHRLDALLASEGRPLMGAALERLLLLGRVDGLDALREQLGPQLFERFPWTCLVEPRVPAVPAAIDAWLHRAGVHHPRAYRAIAADVTALQAAFEEAMQLESGDPNGGPGRTRMRFGDPPWAALAVATEAAAAGHARFVLECADRMRAHPTATGDVQLTELVTALCRRGALEGAESVLEIFADHPKASAARAAWQAHRALALEPPAAGLEAAMRALRPRELVRELLATDRVHQARALLSRWPGSRDDRAVAVAAVAGHQARRGQYDAAAELEAIDPELALLPRLARIALDRGDEDRAAAWISSCKPIEQRAFAPLLAYTRGGPWKAADAPKGERSIWILFESERELGASRAVPQLSWR